MTRLAAAVRLLGLILVGGGAMAGCTPDVAHDPTPASLQFDPQAVPPRVSQPTSLIINPQTGLIDFSVAGLPIPADCGTPPLGLSPAECAFDQYLQTLDGFPTVTPAQTPASTTLDPTTLTAGTNVVVVGARGHAVVSDVLVGFDNAKGMLTVRPKRSWAIGESYWVGVRGYANGVRASDGREVVGSPTQALLKQTDPLPCGATDPSQLDPRCPALALLLQSPGAGMPAPSMDQAARSLFQLEAIRQSYQAGWALMNEVGGLPKAETAVLWNFPIHGASVPELDPTVPALLPRATAADEIRVAVQGTIDPATLSPFVFKVQYGSVVVMDLTAAQANDTVGGFPTVSVTFSGGDIIIKGQAPFVAGHQYGLFFTHDLHDAGGAPLVPSPVSVLLRLQAPLVDGAGHSTISTVSDQDAAMLEAGRQQLATLFDNPSFTGSTNVRREQLVYCFAFAFGGAP